MLRQMTRTVLKLMAVKSCSAQQMAMMLAVLADAKKTAIIRP